MSIFYEIEFAKYTLSYRDVEFVEVDVVQEHVDAAKVLRRDVDLLPEEAAPHFVLAEDLGEF